MFELPDLRASSGNGKAVRRTEHFWLCGICAEAFTLEQNADKNVSISPKPTRHRFAPVSIVPTAMAS